MNVMGGMESEHCSSLDSFEAFTTSNGSKTTSNDEFEARRLTLALDEHTPPRARNAAPLH